MFLCRFETAILAASCKAECTYLFLIKMLRESNNTKLLLASQSEVDKAEAARAYVQHKHSNQES